jgi:bifunctional enzyme CysN/CysC
MSAASPNVRWHGGAVSAEERSLALGGSKDERGAIVWFTGLSGSGKSTVAVEVERMLVHARRPAYLLDGDNLRHGLNGDLGFSSADRAENIRRVGEVAVLFADASLVALVPVISPFRADRDAVRARAEDSGVRFVEVFVDTDLATCEARDPKGLYAKARAGEIRDMTGIDSPYEPPDRPELVLSTEDGTPAQMAELVIAALDKAPD